MIKKFDPVEIQFWVYNDEYFIHISKLSRSIAKPILVIMIFFRLITIVKILCV